ncbi:3-phosphoshikimate 1-carboxyvinyltransferase [Cohnella lubricantis]|uniref:3-phosphoshikimate 1-carboxyvinyltransferase n=1 Tax=Cohnella lubricantis TaxID=2163172 RepID=A0A841THF3_9BACL|nr:3-phosphoshikimate 1-carboxyvinyltransferase [Cohnella lubricantis]MBB6679575.1 3-phosphoshikimate 1-carboxyvinyltransferase [Cohnella lubricantis]MBP2120579.1 3-phosphoshikimate 1-carboxyvinyltransferase [Cohnella lubricantis]
MAKSTVYPYQGTLSGTIRIPPSKYHLHRALIFGSLAEGETVIHGKSGALHIRDTLNSLHDFGISIRPTPDGYIVRGGSYRPRNGRIRVGSSGSTLQFMLGLGSLSEGAAPVYNGHKALRERPIGPLLEALGSMGVKWSANQYKMPVAIQPGRPKGGHVQIPGTLSQWISGLLILAPFADKDTIIEALPPHNELTYVKLTIEMQRQFGIFVEEDPSGTRWRVPAGQRYKPAEISIEPDLSSAAFPLVLSALYPSDVTLQGIAGFGSHPENKVLEIIEDFGVKLEYDVRLDGVRIRHSNFRPIGGREIDMRHIPDLIPAMSVLASLSQGSTILRNIGPGRMKESNRVKAMLQLNKMGARIREIDDDLHIEGVDRLTGASISTYNDHRVQMAFTLAALRASDKASELTFPNAYQISYTEFFDHLAALGVRLGQDAAQLAETY